MAPAGAGRNMYLDVQGNVIEDASTVGYRAAGVPGTVAGFSLALERYGTMKIADVIAPAVVLAREGVELSYHESESLRESRSCWRGSRRAGGYFAMATSTLPRALCSAGACQPGIGSMGEEESSTKDRSHGAPHPK
jgi:gamma-glutamyltranspeptidase